MLLRERLEEYTKEQLLDHARSFEIKRCSGLRKAELIERILQFFCSEEVLRSRLSCLTKEQLRLFRRACTKPQDISIHEVMDSMQLYVYWLGAFEEPSDRFIVYDEVAEVFKKIDDEAFKAEQFKKGWLMKCIRFHMNYYGIAPLEILYELYKLKVREPIDEMISMLWKMPVDIVEACIFSMRTMGLEHWPKKDPIYSARGLFVHIPLIEAQEVGNLLNSQMTKSFYIPSVKQIEELSQVGYEESSLAYSKLRTFFMKKLNLNYNLATTWCLNVWANSYYGKSMGELLQKLEEDGIVFDSEKQVNEFIKLLMDAHNSTRMKENRGHTPNEIQKSQPKILTGSPLNYTKH